MKKIPYFIFLICAVHLRGQTLSESDRISINKRTYTLITSPLDRYFIENPSSAPDFPAPAGLKERLYRAHWNVENRRLILAAVEGMRKGVPLHLGRLPISAEWYSGILVIPTGKELYFDLNGEATDFSRYQLYIVEKGHITEGKSMTYDEYEEYKRRQFQSFKQTKDYLDMIESLKEYGLQGNFDEYIFGQNIGFLDISVPFS